MNQDEVADIIRNNADAQRLPHAVAYVIDSQEREVFNPLARHVGEAIYIERSGMTRAIIHRNGPPTYTHGSGSIYEWIEIVHQRQLKGDTVVKHQDGYEVRYKRRSLTVYFNGSLMVEFGYIDEYSAWNLRYVDDTIADHVIGGAIRVAVQHQESWKEYSEARWQYSISS